MSNRNANAQELAESVLSLYDVSVPHRDEIIKKIYMADASFTDPLVTVRGVENIQAQFRVLPRFIKSSKATLVRGSMAGSSVLTIDSSVVYRLKPFPSWLKVVIRQFSVLELKNGKIAAHTDHYDFYSVMSNIPFVSFLYDQFRPVFGATTSALIKRLLPPAAEEAAPAQVTSPGSSNGATATATVTK
ncbi:TPA: hypothetical protein N0F65_000797 [Lagenidium giganteum]|uniref:SnoaL-like domain-containing protein n=1 Tax=Lagenidium giganteum TaxID=4803 RepID=A0AAV2ZHW0_9STRA|nr:TPA: hypothetical protein N0F65_000797 [Lagenidium giganteum]